MSAERCDECGFDGDAWSDADAVAAIAALPSRWKAAIDGVPPERLSQRPIPDRWSIGEYVDHVREVLFAMRFVLDSAVNQPGIDLGAAPEPVFEPTPRRVDLTSALSGLEREAAALHDRLTDLSPESWSSTAIVGGDVVDAGWICRHALHDASHHLMDIERLRVALHD